MPWWVLQTLMDPGIRKLVLWIIGGLLALLVAIPLLVVVVISGLLGGLEGGTPGSAAPATGIMAQWEPAVAAALSGTGIPVDLEMGLISHESGGAWTATNSNVDGTTDAGLAQINSANWRKYGLVANPYDPRKNLATSVTILSGDLAACSEHVGCGLYSYNAGSQAAGELLNPSYAGDVQAAAQALAAQPPTVYVWPLGGGGSKGQAPQIPVAGEVTFVVASLAASGRTVGYGPWSAGPHPSQRQWPVLETAESLQATNLRDQQVSLRPCTSAPKALAQLLPPDSGCQYATVPFRLGQAALQVTGQFVHWAKVAYGTGKAVRMVWQRSLVPAVGSATATPLPEPAASTS